MIKAKKRHVTYNSFALKIFEKCRYNIMTNIYFFGWNLLEFNSDIFSHIADNESVFNSLSKMQLL